MVTLNKSKVNPVFYKISPNLKGKLWTLICGFTYFGVRKSVASNIQIPVDNEVWNGVGGVINYYLHVDIK